MTSKHHTQTRISSISILTRFTLSDDHVTTFQNIFELFEFDITLSRPGLRSRGDDGLLHCQLDDQRLRVILVRVQADTTIRRTSVLENNSLSTKSATPSSRMLVSAKATPTVFVLAFEGAPAVAGEEATRMAMTTGADMISMFPKSISSTSCRFPGEAYALDSITLTRS